VPSVGIAGLVGEVLIVILIELAEVHPFAEAVKVYVPAGAVTMPAPEILVPADGVIV
jgi:hypothetical protein